MMLGAYISPDDAICVRCLRRAPYNYDPAAMPENCGEITPENPAPIFADTEADAPTWCAECAALIPHSLTPEGYEYLDAIDWRADLREDLRAIYGGAQ